MKSQTNGRTSVTMDTHNDLNREVPVRLRDSDGLYSMVAIDQRESLRVMLSKEGQAPVTDDDLRAFKVEVAQAISPVASALLVDADYALQPILDADALAPGCDLIVAVDIIKYNAAGGAVSTSLREDLLESTWDSRVAGLKFLLLWTPDEWLGCSEDDVRRYIAAAADAGVESVFEVVVRESDGSSPTPDRQAELLVEAAAHTASLNATLYKTEVPFRNVASADDVIRVSQLVTDRVSCPWVVLSSGVKAEDFPEAVTRTAQGGAEGFLAGRAVWGKATQMAFEPGLEYLKDQSVRAVDELRRAAISGRSGFGRA
jgi:sulfofructosephosphate aldolase